MEKLLELFLKIWDDDSILMKICVAIGVLFFIIFGITDAIALYLFGIVFAVGISFGISEKCLSSFQRIFLVALIIIIIITAIFGNAFSEIFSEVNRDIFSSSNKTYCEYCGGRGYFGGGSYGQMVDCPSCDN